MEYHFSLVGTQEASEIEEHIYSRRKYIQKFSYLHLYTQSQPRFSLIFPPVPPPGYILLMLGIASNRHSNMCT
jgi:hypothetical protein